MVSMTRLATRAKPVVNRRIPGMASLRPGVSRSGSGRNPGGGPRGHSHMGCVSSRSQEAPNPPPAHGERKTVLAGSSVSDLDLQPDLDDLARRHAKVGRRALRVALENGKEHLSPPRHAGPARRHDGFTSEIVGQLARGSACQMALADREIYAFLDIRCFHEAVAQDHAADALPDRDDLDPVGVIRAW